LSQYETIIIQDAGVKAHESESPPSFGLKAGAFADLGTLILTNQRLVYIMKGGAARAAAWGLGSALAGTAVERSVSKAELDEIANHPGSYSIPLREITSVKAAKKMGQSYVSINNRSAGMKPAYAFVMAGGGPSNQDWANAINTAIARLGATQNASPTYSVEIPPPPPGFVAPTCPTCGGQLTFIQQYQRWYCYKDQKYA
jgi:hypothetical protein